MRALLSIGVPALLAACSCGGVIFTSPGPQQYYPEQNLQRQAAAIVREPSPEVRLPFVERVTVPGTVYADETFTVRFDISAHAAQHLLTPRALPPLWLQAEQLPEKDYAGRITLGPWLLAEPAPLLDGAYDEVLTSVDLSLRLSYPGTYILATQSADRPLNGGRPARYTEDGTEFIRGEVAIRTTELRLVVLPARQPAQPRFYNEPFGAYRSSEATWGYANSPGLGQPPLRREQWDW